jgi:hypothetical protein
MLGDLQQKFLTCALCCTAHQYGAWMLVSTTADGAAHILLSALQPTHVILLGSVLLGYAQQ